MAETMSANGDPDKNFTRVYKEWAEGGWGMIITGILPTPKLIV